MSEPLVDYMGDGVYAVELDYGIELRANDHRADRCTDTIVLEPEVLEAIVRFAKRVEEARGKE